MNYTDTISAINERRKQMFALRQEMRELQAEIEPEVVQDYAFQTLQGEVKLRDLFMGRETLFVIHNMGRKCSSCTQWADGFNGVLAHLEDRASFVVSTPDSPEVQRTFGIERGWKFRMVSDPGDFMKAMGYYREEHGPYPGVSVFKRQGDDIVRVSDTSFGPGDDFNAVYSFLDMLPEGNQGWQPKFHYA